MPFLAHHADCHPRLPPGIHTCLRNRFQASFVLAGLSAAPFRLSNICSLPQGVLTSERRALISRLAFNVFLPALAACSFLQADVSLATFKSWWPVPASSLLNIVLGMILGAAVFPFVGMEPHLRPHFISCAAVGNLGSLLIVLVPSIAFHSSAFNNEDNRNGLAYVLTGLLVLCAPPPAACVDNALCSVVEPPILHSEHDSSLQPTVSVVEGQGA